MTDQTVTTLINADPIIIILLILLVTVSVTGITLWVLRPVLSGRGKKDEAEAESEKIQASTLAHMGKLLERQQQLTERQAMEAEKRTELQTKQFETLNTIALSLNEVSKSQIAARAADEKKTESIIQGLDKIQLTLSDNYESIKDAQTHFEEEVTKRFLDLPNQVKTPIVDDLTKIGALVDSLKIMLADHDTQRIASVKQIIEVIMSKLSLMHDDIIKIIDQVTPTKEGESNA